MLAAELPPYLREAVFRQALAEVHRDLTRHRYLPRIVLRLQVVHSQFVVRADRTLNLLDGDADGLVVFGYVAYGVLREHLGDGQAAQRRDGYQAHERAFEFAYVALDLARDEEGHVVGQRDAVEVCLAL